MRNFNIINGNNAELMRRIMTNGISKITSADHVCTSASFI